MTDLDEAVARAAGTSIDERRRTAIFHLPPPSTDWNALMAAVERLEKTGLEIFRHHRWSGDGRKAVWSFRHYKFDDAPETLALARCIAAAVEHQEKTR